jgi:hypothetical protein
MSFAGYRALKDLHRKALTHPPQNQVMRNLYVEMTWADGYGSGASMPDQTHVNALHQALEALGRHRGRYQVEGHGLSPSLAPYTRRATLTARHVPCAKLQAGFTRKSPPCSATFCGTSLHRASESRACDLSGAAASVAVIDRKHDVGSWPSLLISAYGFGHMPMMSPSLAPRARCHGTPGHPGPAAERRSAGTYWCDASKVAHLNNPDTNGR